MFRIDLHVHTRRYSPCAIATATEMIRAAILAGLDGIAITEHGVEYDRELLRQERERAGLSEFVVLVGQEVACYAHGRYAGEFLVFGCHPPVDPGSTCEPEELVRAVHERGGIVIAAHPFRYSLEVGRGQCALGVDAVEVLNANCDDERNYLARQAAEAAGLPQVAGSDAHTVRVVGRYVTEFDVPVRTEEELVREVKEGRCRAVALASLGMAEVS